VSILTVVAGLFVGIQGADILPEIWWWFSNDEIAGLSLYFAVMLIFAPLIYNFWRRMEPFNPGPQDPQVSTGAFNLERSQQGIATGPTNPDPTQDYEGTFRIEQCPQEGPNTKLQGYVWTFLIASSMVLGAVFGQLIVGLLLILQIETDMSILVRVILGSVAVLAMVMIFLFAQRQISDEFAQKTNNEKRDPERIVLP
jgi:hypothetical protein